MGVLEKTGIERSKDGRKIGVYFMTRLKSNFCLLN